MDTIVHSALDEICSQGPTGLPLPHLWARLTPPLCPALKRAVFSGLTAVPGLKFQARDGTVFDTESKTVEECEALEVRVVADEQLRRCFVGLYDVKASHITPPQQRVLERLALARGNGETQNQLCKEIGMPANNFFYVVKRLESWGLIVRQSTILRTKETSSEKEPKKSQPVHTNLIRLQRYASPLSSQQRLEITKEGKNVEESLGEDAHGADSILEGCGQDDVLVKDFLPALKDICDRLEQAEGKVLVVSDVKRELGYRETRGHRAWRNICNRLKQAGLVEVFEAKVTSEVETPTKSKKSKSRGQNKPVSCLRLLKKFSPKLFGQKTPDSEYDCLVSEHGITSGDKVWNTEQLVELPLEQQIVDMIDAEGSKGLLGVDVCKRLGISNKTLDNLSNTIVPRFGLHQLSENRKRGSAYRFWTRGNFLPEFPNSLSNTVEDGLDEHQLDSPLAKAPLNHKNSQNTLSDSDFFSSSIWLTGENTGSRVAQDKPKDGSLEERGSGQMVSWAEGSQDLTHETSISVVSALNGPKSNSIVAVLPSPAATPLNFQQGQRYPSLTSAQRELRILERLKTDKIIIKPELQRWLESFEKDKKTRMDRKTLTRCLKKLKLEGLCKLMDFSIPGVSNCGRHREVSVVLHPSVEGSASELSDQVHDKQRSFEMQSRSALSHPKKEAPVPVLHGIERIQLNSNSDAQSAKSEAMRANGFVLAKMVRTKLLHHFLWDYVNTVGYIEGPSLRKHVNAESNPHSSCLLFDLDTAIKAMPLELFLQVVGSALKWKDMLDKCKKGLLLSDFPDEEYKSLMDTRATERLSWLIHLMCRLKLIRLVADESCKEAANDSRATLTHALELKPYVEEPPPMGQSPGHLGSVDLRPHFRHDFVLSTSEALDKYWLTLEYCYAAADPKAALHAFPGSVASEVCLYRSWTTVRVMKAEQRAELLKRIKDQQSKKLTFKECKEIAKDLNLTLEQVLRVYYDNRQQRLNRFQGDMDVQGAHSETRNNRPHSRGKRKIYSERSPAKRVKVRFTAGSHGAGQGDNVEEHEFADEQEHHELSDGQSFMPMLKQSRQPKFSWTEERDRHLLIQYTRQKAVQGARRGTDWASISDLPAPADACRRRISVLMKDIEFRKSLMRLCNLLTQRYAKYLDREKGLMLRNVCGQESDCQEKHWDDFDDGKIKGPFHEVLMLKQRMKLDSAKKSGSASQGTHNSFANIAYECENDREKQQIDSSRRSRLHRLPQKFVKHLKEGVITTGRVNQSLAVSSAVELFKLVFLTNSKAAEMPNMLAETLRCYSEHDLFSAFDYLRQKKIMVGSGPSQPFVLSQNFLRSLSLSQFPANTGKRAARLANWIHEKEKKLMEGVVNLPSDLQCGDIFYLFALVSSGELSISPVLPREGVGEAEDSRSTKRKYDDLEFDDYGGRKKQKFLSQQECEIFSRREKGFPGITVSLSRATISRSNIIEFFKDEDQTLLFSENDHFYATLGQKATCTSSSINTLNELPDFGCILPDTVISGGSIWEVVTNYTIQSLSQLSDREHSEIYPELIKTAYTNIQKAGDQGLSMSKVSECMGMQGTIPAEHVVDALEFFGLVLKVNGYNSVHVVDALYRTKYFLTSKTSPQDDERARPHRVGDETSMVVVDESHEREMNCINADEVHKVTILNLSEDTPQLSNSIHIHDKLEGSGHISTTSTGEKKKNQSFDVPAAAFQPILPWINGDGTINGIVYKGLTRRILGIVTQNPGILEDAILNQMEVLNPQNCRKLLELMVLDNHLIVRKMSECTTSSPPALLESLLHSQFKKPKFIRREHYFANPMCTLLL